MGNWEGVRDGRSVVGATDIGKIVGGRDGTRRSGNWVGDLVGNVEGTRVGNIVGGNVGR